MDAQQLLWQLQAFWKLMKISVAKWQSDNIPWLAASMAYYTLFSLAPMFVLVIAIGGTIFGEKAVKGQIVGQIQGFVGFDAALAIQKMIEAGQELTFGPLSNLLTIAVIIFTATNVFAQFKQTLNAIWETGASGRNWVSGFLLERVISLFMVVSTGLLLLSLVVINVILSSFGDVFSVYVPAFTHYYLWQSVNFVVSFLIILLVFLVINRVVPDTDIQWKDVWLGSALSAFLFTVGKFLISIYLANSSMITLFGAASSFVVILIWVYYSMQILLWGAAVCHSYAITYGSHVDGTPERKSLRRHITRVNQIRKGGKKKRKT